MSTFNVINFGLTLLFGAFGWFIANLVYTPWSDFLKTKRQIHEKLIYYGNIHTNQSTGDPTLDSEWATATPVLRELACKLNAEFEAFWPWHYLYAKLRKYNINEACGALFGMSNSHGDVATIKAEDVRIGLKLKRSLDDAHLSYLRQKAGLSPKRPTS